MTDNPNCFYEQNVRECTTLSLETVFSWRQNSLLNCPFFEASAKNFMGFSDMNIFLSKNNLKYDR